MISKKIKIKNGKSILEVEVFHLDRNDGKKLKILFDIWKRLNFGVEKYGRKVNIPEVISEGMFCVYSGSLRFHKKISGKGKVSFDSVSARGMRKEQIKASSVEFDLSTFGPKTEWDDLYFLDFFNGGKLDGTFNVYRIPNKKIYSSRVNKNQTMMDQQGEKRRPRFSITKKIIMDFKLKPVAKNVKVW